MKNGYYLSAYIEINEYANYYKIDTKRHDQNISLWYFRDGEISLLRYWELERFSRIKHHNKAFFSKEQACLFINQLLTEFNISIKDLVAILGTPQLRSSDDYENNTDFNYHSLCHLFSSLLIDTKKFYSENILAFSTDLDSDYITETKSANRNDYVGCYSNKGNINYFPIESPALIWSIASHDNQLGEGTLMALGTAISTEFCYNFDFSNERFFDCDYKRNQRIYDLIKKIADECSPENISETLKGYDENFSFKDNITSALMKVVQSLSKEIMIRNINNAKKLFNIDTKDTYLAMSGGFALNCPINSFMLKKYNFKGFLAPPCVNDSGQSLGIALYYFYRKSQTDISFILDSAFLGKSYSIDGAKNNYKQWIKKIEPFNPQKALEDISKSAVVWFDGNSEIGPRALGHRSIISSPKTLKAKNQINKIKKRQAWRPVAPIALFNESSIWFQDFINSPFMLLTFQINAKLENKIAAVSHLDSSARLQTIDNDDENIVKVLTAAYDKDGIPLLCNTSLNDYGEPIIETPEQAIDFALKKNLAIAYINGYRFILKSCLQIDKLPENPVKLNLWSNTPKYIDCVLNKAEYEFYYWSNCTNEFPLTSEDNVKIVKRLYNSYQKKCNYDNISNKKNFYY